MVGQTVSNYRIIEKLGEGGMGVVFKAQDLNLRRTVALKFLSPQAIGNPDEKARLWREAQATAALDHPAICPVYGIHEHDGSVFLTMAYIDGPNLAAKVKQRPLLLDEALDIAMQMAQALEEAHQHGVIHRDIKPSNVMLTARGQVKILDFGLAQIAGSTRITKTGTMMGTPAYMSPEQAEGRAPTGAPTSGRWEWFCMKCSPAYCRSRRSRSGRFFTRSCTRNRSPLPRAAPACRSNWIASWRRRWRKIHSSVISTPTTCW